MKKSRISLKLDKMLSDKFFEQIFKDNPKVLLFLEEFREYNMDLDYKSNMSQRVKKINKLRNEINLEK